MSMVMMIGNSEFNQFQGSEECLLTIIRVLVLAPFDGSFHFATDIGHLGHEGEFLPVTGGLGLVLVVHGLGSVTK